MITFSMSDGATKELDKIRFSQLRWALKEAIRTVGLQAQDGVRQGMAAHVGLRREDYELNRIMVVQFPTKAVPVMVIRVDPNAKNLIRLISGESHLGWFPYSGKNYQWIPNYAVFQNKIILRSNPLHPANLGFGFAASGAQGPRRANYNAHNQGNNRTFVLDHPKKKPGVPQVWQRVASSKKLRTKHKGNVKETTEERFQNTRMLYLLVDEQHTPAKLKFYEPIKQIITYNWADAMKSALDVAIQPKAS